MKYLTIALLVSNGRENRTVLHREQIDLEAKAPYDLPTRHQRYCDEVLAEWSHNPMTGFFASRLRLIGESSNHQRNASIDLDVQTYVAASSCLQQYMLGVMFGKLWMAFNESKEVASK